MDSKQIYHQNIKTTFSHNLIIKILFEFPPRMLILVDIDFSSLESI